MLQMDIEFDIQSESSGFQKLNEINQNLDFDFTEMIQYDNLPQLPLFQLDSLKFISDFKQEEFNTKFEFTDSTLALGEESTHQEYVPESVSNKNHSKDGLKFSRRISKMMTKQIGSDADSLITFFLGASASVISSIITSNGIEEVEVSQKELVKAQQEVLLSIWGEFKDILSYNKNKKICIVKAEYWNIVFDKQTFVGLIKQACQAMKTDLSKLFAAYEGILNAFCDVLFAAHILMTFIAILKDDSTKGGQQMREMETIDSMLMMIVNPKLFEFYNHRSGKFATECCGKCKICRSRYIPADFQAVLRTSRTKLQIIISEVCQVPSYVSNIREDEAMRLLCQFL